MGGLFEGLSYRERGRGMAIQGENGAKIEQQSRGGTDQSRKKKVLRSLRFTKRQIFLRKGKELRSFLLSEQGGYSGVPSIERLQ